MNASGRPDTCKSNGAELRHWQSGERVSNAWESTSHHGGRGVLPRIPYSKKRPMAGGRWALVGLGSWWGKSSTKPKILSRSERMIGHTGTETRPRRFRAAAVRNLGQWAKAWSSHAAWGMKAKWVVNLWPQSRLWHGLGEKSRLTPCQQPR